MIPVTANFDGARVWIRGPYSAEAVEFYASLPGSRWNPHKLAWECDLTPAAAFRIASQCPVPVEACVEIERMAADFMQPINNPLCADARPPICKTEPWKHQARAFWFAYPREASLLAMAMGCGKSLVAVQLCDNWNCKSVLILCPLSVKNVWRREFLRHAARPWRVCVLDKGSSAEKAREADAFLENARFANEPGVIVVNYESARMAVFSEWSLSRTWDLVIADESHRIKTATSASSKYLEKLSRRARRRLCLTGTPMPHSPIDIFGQMLFLDRGLFGTSLHRFRSRFAISGHFGANHIVGFKNQQELAERMSLITFEVGNDVLDLPDVQHITIPVSLSPFSRRLYDEIECDMIGFLQDGGSITAANGLVRLLRCQQVACGHVTVDGDNGARCVGTEKAEVLRDILSDCGEPVVVCCRFRHDLSEVRRICKEENLRYGELSGTSNCLTEDATMPPDIDVLGVQERSGGVGVDLTRARICVIWSTSFSLGDYEQFLARLHRPGQTRNVIYYHIVAEKTVDETICKSLESKRDVIDGVLEYLKSRGEP